VLPTMVFAAPVWTDGADGLEADGLADGLETVAVRVLAVDAGLVILP